MEEFERFVGKSLCGCWELLPSFFLHFDLKNGKLVVMLVVSLVEQVWSHQPPGSTWMGWLLRNPKRRCCAFPEKGVTAPNKQHESLQPCQLWHRDDEKLEEILQS